MKAKFGRYVFLKKLAVGGMAEVFLARRASFGGFSKFVVIKRLLPQHKGRAAYEQLFLTEARTGAILHHPHIAGLYDLGKLDDHYFMAMEFVHGLTLSDLHAASAEKSVPVPPGVVAGLGIAIAEALHYAHEALDEAGEPMRVLHHDITPQNIQISFDGDVKLLDFGVATRVGQPVSGGRRGKPGYMSPEALRRDALDARSDLYSLGVVLWELATGKKAPRGPEGSPEGTVDDAWQPEPLVAPTSIAPSFPKALEMALMAAVSNDVSARPIDGRAFARTLRAAARSLELDTGAEAFVAWMRAFMAERVDAERAALVELVQRSEPKAAAPSMTGAPQPMLMSMSGEFDALVAADLLAASQGTSGGHDALGLPDDAPPAPPAPSQPAPAPERVAPALEPAPHVTAPPLRGGFRGPLPLILGALVGAAAAWFIATSAPTVGSVEFTTTPPEARVYSGVKLLGMTPFTASNLPVPTTLNLRVVAAGHAEWNGTLTLDAQRPNRGVELQLKPTP